MMGMLGPVWEMVAGLLAVLTPLVAVPLTVITFYLRSLREVQASTRSETAQRINGLEAALEELRRQTGQFERDYATKEEWIRETMLARRNVEQLRATAVRLETQLGALLRTARRPDGGGGAAAQAGGPAFRVHGVDARADTLTSEERSH